MSIAQLIHAAKANGVMIATAESCTGGLVSGAITDVAGSSAVFDRGYVTYSNDAKIQMLGVNPQTLANHGAVSEEVAAEMALGAIARSNAQVAVSITGIAGPGSSDHKPEGRVCFGLARQGQAQTETIEFEALGRSHVRRAACDHAILLLIKALDSLSPSK